MGLLTASGRARRSRLALTCHQQYRGEPAAPATPSHASNSPTNSSAGPRARGHERHHGTFAEGQADPESYAAEDHVGTFAEAEEQPLAQPTARPPVGKPIGRVGKPGAL